MRDEPMTVTPLCSMSFPGCVATQFPPASAARSTTTDPGFMAASIYDYKHIRLNSQADQQYQTTQIQKTTA